MPKRDADKPRGRMTAYAFFVQTCREEHKKKHPGEQVVFSEFSKKCSEKWKAMGAKDKKRFEEMADKDKIRYDREMANYVPPSGEKGKGRKRRKKDPNAPKRALSAFMFFCNDERESAKGACSAGASVGEIAKELGRRWEKQTDKSKWEAQAAKDRERYEREMAVYKGKKPKPAPVIEVAPVEDDDDEEEEHNDVSQNGHMGDQDEDEEEEEEDDE